jgi:hypothetical protein
MRQLQLSARAYHRTQSVKLSRTIADLAGYEEIQSVHSGEASQYLPKNYDWVIKPLQYDGQDAPCQKMGDCRVITFIRQTPHKYKAPA